MRKEKTTDEFYYRRQASRNFRGRLIRVLQFDYSRWHIIVTQYFRFTMLL